MAVSFHDPLSPYVMRFVAQKNRRLFTLATEISEP